MPGPIDLKCTFASLPRTTRGKAIVLGGDPKGENFLYCNTNNVYIKDINDPSKCDVYADHAAAPNVAKYAPSRFYIASGDSSGKVLIWDTTQAEHLVKYEYPVLGGTIKDIAWDSESKRLAIVGEGREFYAKCISWDMGTTLGEISGQEKVVNSVDYRPVRPFRIVTGSDDQKSMVFEGPKFKYMKTNGESTNFVNCVRYHPKGEVFITGGSDGKALIYEGKTSEYIGALGGDKAHKGGIYALDFSPDGSEVLTVSGDKTAKIWNLASKELVVEFVMGKEIDDMQVGCLWQGDNIITVSLSGYINYLDKSNPSSPRRIQKGHNKAIMSMAVTPDKSRVYTGGSDGKIFYWDLNTGICEIISGKGHSNQVTDMAVAGDWLISIGLDDVVRYTSISSNEYDSNASKLPSQPKTLAALPNGIAVITCIEHIVVVDKGDIMFEQAVKFGPISVDIHPGQTRVAFGGSKEIHIFELDGTSLKGMKRIECDINDDWTCVRFSPDGAYLAAAGGTKRYTALYKLEGDDFKEVYKTTKQTGRIYCLAWSPESRQFATGSLDGSLAVWCLEPKYDKSLSHYEKFAHKKAYVQNVAWLSENELITSSNDCCIRQWTVNASKGK
ncbi:WD repeat-containing protein 1-like [Mercenaria mercenaria]|uniref:WD repeat-containing protein 1-like n=1 Tax=Mercenaria mercenaria TaxID=6596 RepID=UPI001E1E21C4|nr:WD repeat-containing protein 1-like [Mercenaria mercenaria]